MKKLPAISKQTFWDVEILEIDYDEYYEWVINRVFDRGTLEEVRCIEKYYGKEFVKDCLVNTTQYLPFHAILLAMGIFKLKYSDFKCCKNKPFPPDYWK